MFVLIRYFGWYFPIQKLFFRLLLSQLPPRFRIQLFHPLNFLIRQLAKMTYQVD